MSDTHKHRCLRCQEEFHCTSPGGCEAGSDVLPNIITLQPDGSIAIKPHCPEQPDWAWTRAYGERRLASLRSQLAASTEENARLRGALVRIAVEGIYGDGELPIGPSELREIARAALSSSPASGVLEQVDCTAHAKHICSTLGAGDDPAQTEAVARYLRVYVLGRQTI